MCVCVCVCLLFLQIIQEKRENTSISFYYV